jgi:hypothetical protein
MTDVINKKMRKAEIYQIEKKNSHPTIIPSRNGRQNFTAGRFTSIKDSIF